MPYLTPFDFFLSDYLKSAMHNNRPDKIEGLQANIRVEFNIVLLETTQNTDLTSVMFQYHF